MRNLLVLFVSLGLTFSSGAAAVGVTLNVHIAGAPIYPLSIPNGFEIDVAVGEPAVVGAPTNSSNAQWGPILSTMYNGASFTVRWRGSPTLGLVNQPRNFGFDFTSDQSAVAVTAGWWTINNQRIEMISSDSFTIEGIPLADPVITDAAPAYNANYPSSSVFDNNLTTEYASQDSSTDTFIDFAFPAPTLISGFDMTQRNDNARVLTSRLFLDDSPGFGSPLAIVDLVHTNTAQAYNFFPFAPVNARYVRWDVLTANSGVLKANGAAEMNFYLLPGDYNGNGIVDGADYVVWRKDPNRTQAGYNTWRTRFGRTLVGGSGSAAGIQAAVPEPASVMLLIVGTVVAILRGRRIASHVPSSR